MIWLITYNPNKTPAQASNTSNTADSLHDNSNYDEDYYEEDRSICSFCNGKGYELICSNFGSTCNNSKELEWYEVYRDDMELGCPECIKANRPYDVQDYICANCLGSGIAPDWQQ